MDTFKVMILEDDESSRRMLSRAVNKEGFHVISAEDGKKGMELFDKESPEIIVTDLQMPGMNGLDVLRKAKEKNPGVQVVLITAMGETDTAIEALREGVLDYIKKPIDLNHLIVNVEKALEKLNLVRALRYRTRELELSRQLLDRMDKGN